VSEGTAVLPAEALNWPLPVKVSGLSRKALVTPLLKVPPLMVTPGQAV